jgi:hypothetical protein
LRQRGDWILDGAAKYARVQIHFRTGHFDLKGGDAAQAITYGRHATRDHPRIGNDCHVTLQGVAILFQKRAEVRTSALLFAFDHQMQVHRQLTVLLDRFLNSENVRKDLALVVG